MGLMNLTVSLGVGHTSRTLVQILLSEWVVRLRLESVDEPGKVLSG